MAALQFLVDTLLGLAQLAFMLRLMLQWARGDFRNPLLRGLVDLTNWAVLPMRRVLPPIRRLDTATAVLVLAFAFLRVAATQLIAGTWHFSTPGLLLLLMARDLVRLVLSIGFWSVVGYALLSMMAQGQWSPPLAAFGTLAEPILRPIRRFIPSPANLDLSPLWACILIQVLLLLLP